MSEGAIMRSVMLRLGQLPFVKLFRNQVGTYKLGDGRVLSSGLCVGSSDLIGWTEAIVTPEMVGQRIAIFTALEVKTNNGRVTKEQKHFLAQVSAAGGLCGVARDVADGADLVVGGMNRVGASIPPKR